MFLTIAPLALLLLSVSHIAASRYHYPRHHTTLSHLSLRPAFARDAIGNWTFMYSKGKGDNGCPQSIRHMGLSRPNKGVIRIFHHRIIQDQVRCTNELKSKGRRFRMFPSKVVVAAVRNRTTPYRVPPWLIRLIKTSTPVRRAFRAAKKHGERYLIGFEGRERDCDNKKFFNGGTTAFLVRPVRRDLTIRGIRVTFTPGKRYLIMIPRISRRRKRFSCVYSSELRAEGGTADSEDDSSGDNVSDESGNELAANDDQPSCFPATASVRLESGRNVFMKDLSVTDSVQVGMNDFASVFLFTHRLRKHPSVFRRIELHSGEKLDVTGGHFVYVNEQLVTASQVTIGDMMQLANGTYSVVKVVHNVAGTGLYNPQTTHSCGDIIVNGIRVSTYTKAVKPVIAHTALSPLRAAFRLLKMDLSFGYLDGEAKLARSAVGLIR